MSNNAQPSSAAEVREYSSQASNDPFSAEHQPTADEDQFEWLYAEGGFELALLHRIVAEGFEANAFVHYAKNIGPVPTSAAFERICSDTGPIDVWPTGPVRIFVDGTETAPRIAHSGLVRIVVAPGHHKLRVEVTSVEGTPAAIAVPKGHSAEWRAGGNPADVRPGGHTAPHLLDEPVRVLPLHIGEQELFDTGMPVLARPVLRCIGTPSLTSGESPEEALSGISETSHEVIQREDGCWTTRHRLGFRYLKVKGAQVLSAHVEANVRPLPAAGGAFACSDPTLNDIWATAAYTLKICMQGLVLDGIKRDRMPWLGDQALNTITNAFAVGDGTIIRDGLSALGRPSGGYVNGIADYSLWWLVNRFFLSLYFSTDDLDDAHRIAAFVSDLDTYTTPTGVFRPTQHGDDFQGAGGGPVFIDWGVAFDSTRDLTALQVLWYWALTSTANVLASEGHSDATRCADRAAQVRSTLWDQAWDHDAHAWREYLDGGTPNSAYPNMLAVLAGLHDGPIPDGVQEAIRQGHTGTPFMTGFALRAQAVAGDTDGAINRLRDLWTPMMEAGHGTFWEEFQTPGMSPFEMYGRPFGKSLCHAWGSAPAAILPEALLGIQPLDQGWKRFTVQPALGQLDWAAAVVPTPHGEIFISAGPRGTIVEFPAGTAWVRPDGSVTHGPAGIHEPTLISTN